MVSFPAVIKYAFISFAFFLIAPAETLHERPFLGSCWWRLAVGRHIKDVLRNLCIPGHSKMYEEFEASISTVETGFGMH